MVLERVEGNCTFDLLACLDRDKMYDFTIEVRQL